MSTPEAFFKRIKDKLGRDGIIAFLSAFVAGLLVHMPALTFDVPNHDGLASLYFDQNMITSGRWFLGLTCGISSYYALPWVTGLLAILYISVASLFICKTLGIKRDCFLILAGCMLAVFPSIASNFAYAFTMDGYMLGLLLSVIAVYMVDKYTFGFIIGGLLLAFGMGTYQSYVSVAMVLSLFKVLDIWLDDKKERKIKATAEYIGMGVIGLGLYYGILKILLAITGKTLDTYQGINDAGLFSSGIFGGIKHVYSDFVSFTVRSRIMFSNVYAGIAFTLLLLIFLVSLLTAVIRRGLWKKPVFYLSVAVAVILFPVCANGILLVSPGVTYHLLMRYQWVLFPLMMLAFIERNTVFTAKASGFKSLLDWAALCCVTVMTFSFALSDNIAYSNLEKKYEKTYAYTLRLVDRIEQTEGFYRDIPIRFIGVVGTDPYPETDYTGEVTGSMLSVAGDYLIYKPENYALFIKNYLGVTLNIQPSGANDFYYEDWYVSMPSFPAAGSIVIKDGVMYIKTENSERNR